MLYIHYEHFTIADKKLTRLVFSSQVQVYTKSFSKTTWANAQKIIDMMKQIPYQDRTMDNATKIWTIPNAKFDLLLQIFSDHTKHEWIYQSELEDFVRGTKRQKSVFEEKKPPKAEDFFYNNAQPVAQSVMPIQVIEQKLEELFSAIDNVISLSVLTADEKLRLYKKAARRFHPDLNNGDSSRMTELNMYWQQYKQMKGVN